MRESLQAAKASGRTSLPRKALFWLLMAGMIMMSAAAAQAAGFREKPISSSAKKQSGNYSAGKTAGKSTDAGFVNAMADTSVRLFRETLASGQDGQNILISPDSILTAMAMVENGAAGETLSEMKAAFGGISAKNYGRHLYTLHKRLSGSKDSKYTIAASIWFKKGRIRLKKPYLRQIVSWFGADVYAAPFTARTVRDINSWVYNHTNGKIRSIISRLNPRDRAVVVNAIYFKGKWADPYSGTVNRTFTKENGETRTVRMLEDTEKSYVTVNGAEGFVKYYRGGNTAFMALLPPEGMTAAGYIRGLTGADLVRGYRDRVSTGIQVNTRLPQFGYDYQASLKEPLTRMGVNKAFSEDAVFSKMSSVKTHIDDVLHKTHIEVNRYGTEAAAATAVVMRENFTCIQDVVIKEVFLDRPFVYTIIDTKTGLPLFIGAVYDPQG